MRSARRWTEHATASEAQLQLPCGPDHDVVETAWRLTHSGSSARGSHHVNLILLEEHDRLDANCVRLADARAAHLLNVLRVTPGQTVRVGLLDGPFGAGTVESVGNGEVMLRCVFDTETPPRPRVDVLLALPRPKVMRRLWPQLAALGVGQIILTNAERVERHYFDTHILTESSYRPLLIDGLQQARDTRLPVISIHRQFKILVEDHLEGLFGAGLRVVADPGGTTSIGAAVPDRQNERVLIAIGPEGGWNAFELRLLAAHGFQLVGLGPRTLRVDTACTALLAIAHATLTESRESRGTPRACG
jgi:16S rRNA (uracil1498-N3)-methyltransferase